MLSRHGLRLEFRIWGLRFSRVEGLGIGVKGLVGFEVQALGFRV
jgi:hypothetical protein